MAQPMTAKQFIDLLTEWNIPFKAIHPDWATHNRNHKGNWGPVNGVALHHTGSDDQKDMPAYLWSGDAELPGPLCHGGIDLGGTVLLCGWGRCNHAGLGDGNVLEKVISEDYTGNLKPKVQDTDGNARFYGFEIMYSGKHVMSDAQLYTAVRVSAAICTFHNWKPESVIGHGEWSTQKWDPGYKWDAKLQKGYMYDMSLMRARVNAEIAYGPAGKPKPVQRTHKVIAGETPWQIAKKELGDGSRWPEIIKLNTETIVLTPGQLLKLPPK